ncbi:MAG: hypothetical protein HN389_10485 [Clostridia bacterium]|nr:hypothetical protein [Clostridia bacterium]
MIEFITEYWLQALFGVMLTGLSFLVRKLFRDAKNMRCATRAVQAGIKCMLRDRIISCHEKYMPALYCPLSVRASMEDMYMAYKALGGNGAIYHIVEELNDLPTIRKGDKE